MVTGEQEVVSGGQKVQTSVIRMSVQDGAWEGRDVENGMLAIMLESRR